LLRMVCENCGEPQQISPQQEAWLHHYGKSVTDGQVRKGRGCTQCNGTGYLGRAGVYEMLEMTRPLVEAAGEADPAKFVAAGREQIAGQTLIDHAVEMVLAGRTTLDEAMRISSQIEES
jgi:MSHA biogenesis protein MshE